MLSNGLTNWVKDNSQLYKALEKHSKFLVYSGKDIIGVNLNLLDVGYRERFILLPDRT